MIRLLGTKAVADILGVTQSRVRQIIAAGELAATRVGRDLLVTESDLDRYMSLPRRKAGRPSKRR